MKPDAPETEAILALQRSIVTAMRSGASFATAHKEGGTRIAWTGRHFLREDYGDFPDRITYADEAEFMTSLRRFFDWEVSRDVWPAKPSEIEAWQGILKLLRRA